MSGEPKTPKVTVTAEDVTEKERSPAEEAFCESFLIQSKSAVENMYASNIYHSQKHAKELKDLERQRYFKMSQMTTKQKEMVKKMNQLQDRQEQIVTEKRQQHLKVASKGRIRPQSTSAISDGERKFPRQRMRSGSLTFLLPLDMSLTKQQFSRSTQDLRSDPSLLSCSLPANILSKSSEDLASLGIPKNIMILPAIPKCQRSKSCDDENTDSTFITKMPASPPTHPRSKPNYLSTFNPERRRGSLGAELDRKLDLERRRVTEKFGNGAQSTQTRWIPKPQSRNLPPL